MEPTFSYSSDGEYFYGHTATREAAINDGFATFDNDKIFTARNVEYDPVDVIPRFGAQLVANMKEHALEECGESAEDFLCDLTVGQYDRLGAVIRAAVDIWLGAEGLRRKFFAVKDVETHDRKDAAA